MPSQLTAANGSPSLIVQCGHAHTCTHTHTHFGGDYRGALGGGGGAAKPPPPTLFEYIPPPPPGGGPSGVGGSATWPRPWGSHFDPPPPTVHPLKPLETLHSPPRPSTALCNPLQPPAILCNRRTFPAQPSVPGHRMHHEDRHVTAQTLSAQGRHTRQHGMRQGATASKRAAGTQQQEHRMHEARDCHTEGTPITLGGPTQHKQCPLQPSTALNSLFPALGTPPRCFPFPKRPTPACPREARLSRSIPGWSALSSLEGLPGGGGGTAKGAGSGRGGGWGKQVSSCFLPFPHICPLHKNPSSLRTHTGAERAFDPSSWAPQKYLWRLRRRICHSHSHPGNIILGSREPPRWWRAQPPCILHTSTTLQRPLHPSAPLCTPLQRSNPLSLPAPLQSSTSL